MSNIVINELMIGRGKNRGNIRLFLTRLKGLISAIWHNIMLTMRRGRQHLLPFNPDCFKCEWPDGDTFSEFHKAITCLIKRNIMNPLG